MKFHSYLEGGTNSIVLLNSFNQGENMKTIIKKCIEFGKKHGDQYANEDDHGVKLRLRGKGSGYKEGPEK